MTHVVPAGEARFEHEVKKSRFIGVATRVSSDDAAKAVVAALRNEFPDATHHCWAYVLGHPASSTAMRFDDDGEPAGTAGKPILNVLQHKDVADVLVVVVRYFGGIKLGAGGLARAYGSTASGVMERLVVVEEVATHEATLIVDYADEGIVRHVLDELAVEVISSRFLERVELTLAVPRDRANEIQEALAARTSGRAKLLAV